MDEKILESKVYASLKPWNPFIELRIRGIKDIVRLSCHHIVSIRATKGIRAQGVYTLIQMATGTEYEVVETPEEIVKLIQGEVNE
jgi:hypothetical protein